VTLTGLVQFAAGGATALMRFEFITVKLEAAMLPKFTALTDAKPVPLIVTGVPPVEGPLDGDKLVIVGTGKL
jgi:hypothetical protein